jgi:tetratricopeptide (TPR) repeat protein
MKTSLIFLSLFLIAQAHASDTPVSAKLTDMAALSIQDQSIKKLESLIKQYQGTSREPELLYRLGDLYLERSGLSFRISEGTSVKSKSPLYSHSLKDAIRVYSMLLKKYPYHAFAPFSHFKRGKAYKELADIPKAREDFLYLDQHAKDFDFLDSALLDLADFAQDANHHQEALSYLVQIEKMPTSDYLPIALHKSAWSYFNLGDYQTAINYLHREVDYYYVKIDAKKSDSTAETAFLESSFNDLSLFYFEAINKKKDFASVKDALDTFHKIDSHQKFYSGTVVKFAKLLRAYTLLPELDELRKLLVKNGEKTSETSDVVMLLFQFHFDRHDFKNLAPLLTDLKTIRNEQNEAKIEQMLSGSLADLHKLVLKNKLATQRAVLVRPLVSLTESVNDLLGRNNQISLLANYALAETMFELGEFSQATDNYKSLLAPEYAPILASKQLTHSALMLRLVSSRYQELKKDSLIPEKLKIQSLATKVEPASKEQMASMSEWISWLDQMATAPVAVEEKSSFEAFDLEAAKLLYVYFDREQALARLTKFGTTHADTPEGSIALSIVLDTLAESKVPTRLYDLTQVVLALPKLKNKDFLAKTTEMSANAHLKVTLDNKDLAVTLTRTEECMKKFQSSKIARECQNIHAKTLVELGQFPKAEVEISELLKGEKDELHLKSLLLLRADLRAKTGRTAESIQDLTHYQTLTHYEDAEITEQILEYSWFANDKAGLRALLSNPKVCQGKNVSHCDQYRVVTMLEEGNHPVKYATAFRNTVKTEKELQSVWALYALEDPKQLPFQDRLILLQRLGHSWENLNPLLQIHLAPRMISQVKDTLASIRVSAPGIAPLTADNASIERRMRLMQEVDQTFAKIMKLDWLEIKQTGIKELAEIYKRLVVDLRAIQTPEDLLKPFVSKIAEIQKADENLTSMAMEFVPVAIEPVTPTAVAAGTLASDVKVNDQKARNPGSALAPLPTADSLLLSEEVKAKLPEHLWAEWSKGVKEQRRDYLFHLVSTAELTAPDLKTVAPILKGLVLLQGNAPSEAYALIETAPDSPWKSIIVSQFQRRKP